MANVDIQIGYKDSAWFTANATLVLKVGQVVYLEQTGTYKIGDGVTVLSSLSFLGAGSSITKTSDLINDGDDGNKFISLNDLPSNLILYATTAASDVGGYFKLVSSITDPSYNAVAVDVSTGAITTTNQFISSLITSTNVIVGNPGVINISTIGNIRRTSGTGNAEFYFEVYKRVVAGTETLITTSGNTIPIINTGYAEFSATALWNDGTFLATDRIVLKFYGSRIVGGSDPTYDFQFGGSTPVRSLVLLPLTVVPVLNLDNLQDVNATTPNNNDVLVYESSSQLWKNKTAASSLGYTPENIANKSIDGTFAANNDTLYPSQKAVKTYADGLVTGLLDDRGNYDASSNLWPATGGSGVAGAILKGDLWYISVAGTLGGASAVVGSSIRALSDTPAQTNSNWSILNVGLGYTPENIANKSNSYTASSTTTYASTKALVDGLASVSESVKVIYKDLTNSSPLTGTTAITLLKSALIPANTVTIDDEINIYFRALRSTIGGTATHYFYVNTTASLTGATLLATHSGAASYFGTNRNLFVKSTTVTETIAASFNSGNDNSTASIATIGSLNIDWTADVYIIQAFQNAAGGDSTTSRGITIKRFR